MTPLDRRRFLGASLGLLLPVAFRQQGARPDSTHAGIPAEGPPGFLPRPAIAGPSHPAVTVMDNDPQVVGIEHRVRCPCPCGLDVYTCRTTDFTCSYSPERHREIVGLVQAGLTPDQVVAQLVSKYGESALMAPAPKGFNLLGYLVPGSLVLLLGAAITAVIVARRKQATSPVAVPTPTGAAPAPGSPEEMARLEAALRDLDR